ncbi:putative HVA22-like protein g [Dendrobium catenatum]|uniref:putative HVA22-like protein g n=1 Tax=Dendrobium catenatum TaxID=906689 RepID=UPI00109FF058|nr:putative HVA22-like protein g [Dendrobium catenatum]
MMGGFLTRVSIMILGYAYPAYECYKTVELNRPEIEQLLFWCQYWILVAVLAVFERVGDALISWLPLYGEFKLVFFVYLWHPKTKGTTYIYSTFIQPYMSKHENKIDRTLLELRTRANDLASQYWQNVLSNGRSWFLTILQYVVSQPSSTTEPRHADHASTAPANETEQPLASQQQKTEQTNPVLIKKPEKVKTDSSSISPSSALSKPAQGPASTRSSTSSHHPPPPPPRNEKLIQENLASTNNHNSEETKQEEPIHTVRRLRIRKRVATTANSVH